MFINDLPDSVKYMFVHLYADDTQLYKFTSTEDLNDSIEKINLDLHAVCEWADRNKLVLNSSKSKAVGIGASNVNSIPTIKMNGLDIGYSATVKNLGLVINSRGMWNDHAAKISQRIFIGLRSLWPQIKSTLLRTRSILAKSLLLPHLDYCCIVFYYGLDHESWKVLNNSIKSIVRYVYGLRRWSV